jgi:hypothetical protein
MNYGMRIWLALALTFVPAIQAYLYCGSLDTYPYVICVSVGTAISGIIAFVRYKLGNDVPLVGSDVASTVEARQAKTCLLYLGPPFWLLALALFANQYCDRSPRIDQQVRLLKFSVYRKGPSTVSVESWRDPGATQAIRYDWRRMRGISSDTLLGQQVIVSVRAGALGWTWVESIRIAEP